MSWHTDAFSLAENLRMLWNAEGVSEVGPTALVLVVAVSLACRWMAVAATIVTAVDETPMRVVEGRIAIDKFLVTFTYTSFTSFNKATRYVTAATYHALDDKLDHNHGTNVHARIDIKKGVDEVVNA
eukprot:6195445-Amphidinium_carterae.1